MPTLYLPELLYTAGTFQRGLGMLVSDSGVIQAIGPDLASDGAAVVTLPGRALLPGMVNGHSHSFQRLIRGVAEHAGPNGDDFWAWRNTMYAAASSLTPDELFDVARMAFLEMALSGITAVGEFHYVHRQPDGAPYPDPNLLSKCVIDAARSVGLRICLLRVAYSRAGFELPANPGQLRFYETCDEFLENSAQLARDAVKCGPTVTMGVAPHSIRAVTLADLKRIAAWAHERDLPIHMHIAEQTGELVACEREYGATPVQLLAENHLLSDRLTLVHAIHTAPEEVDAIAQANAMICSCPTTERNLGDGIIDADAAIRKGVELSFGTDSQATINLLEDARELDYHLRLKRQRRVLLDGIDRVEIATRLFAYATLGGARSLRLNVGSLEIGQASDFFTVDLADVSIAGIPDDELLSMILFALERTAVRDVVVDGVWLVREGKHSQQAEIVSRYTPAGGASPHEDSNRT